MNNKIFYILMIFISISLVNRVYAQTTPEQTIENLLISLNDTNNIKKVQIEKLFTPSILYIINNYKSPAGKRFNINIIGKCQKNIEKKIIINSIHFISENEAIAILGCQNKINKYYTTKYTLNIYLLKQNSKWLIDNIIRLDESDVSVMINKNDILEKDNHE